MLPSSTDAPDRSARCLFASAEPSWARVIPGRQLTGLLNLCCLFTPVVYLTDVHLGDNPEFFDSFVSGERNGLYARVKELVSLGCVRLLLRDATVRNRGVDSVVDCESFSDVYRAWVAHDVAVAGVVPGVTEDRQRYFADIDRWSADGACQAR